MNVALAVGEGSKVVSLLGSGVGLGAAYAMVALGFVIIYRATNVVNFAQGGFSMLAAFLFVFFFTSLGFNYALSLLIVLAIMAAFGIVFHFGAYYPVRNRTFVPIIVTTIGASLMIQNGVLVVAGPVPRSVTGPVGSGGFNIAGAHIPWLYVVLLGVMFIVVGIQYLVFERTVFGKRLQATAQDKQMASLLGVNVTGMTVFTFGYSSLVGALAGVLVAPMLTATVGLGQEVVLAAFAATIVGGFGSIPGAIVGGVLVGLVDAFGAGYIATPYQAGYGYALVVLVLIFRPEGIFGEKVGEKA
jgi:branched-chain amino acid transport system permease protein